MACLHFFYENRLWRVRFEDDGEAGLLDRRLGKAFGPAGSG